jgi:hypothetical protein
MTDSPSARLTLQLAFCAPATVPEGTHRQGNNTIMGNGGMQACDWGQPDAAHQTSAVASGGGRLDVRPSRSMAVVSVGFEVAADSTRAAGLAQVARKLEFDEYSVSCVTSAGKWKRSGPHSFVLDLPPPGREGEASPGRHHHFDRTNNSNDSTISMYIPKKK